MNYPTWYEAYTVFLLWTLGVITGWFIREGFFYLEKAKKRRKETGGKPSTD